MEYGTTLGRIYIDKIDYNDIVKKNKRKMKKCEYEEEIKKEPSPMI